MANDQSIEKLFVEIGADCSSLLSDIKSCIKDAEKELEKLEGQGKRTFDEPSKKASGFGSLLSGAVAGAVTAVTTKLIELGTAAVSTFTQMIQQGVELNKTLENAEVIFSAVFGCLSVAILPHKETIKKPCRDRQGL